MTGAVAILGYASLDHVAMLDSVPRPGRTSTIVHRQAQAWPRLGGSPAYVAAALAAAGLTNIRPISWVGDDAAGDSYRQGLREKGIAVDGIAVVAGARTPIAILAYDPDGGCACLYDPGARTDLALTGAQSDIISGAEWLCVTIGPKAATELGLKALRPTAKLAWIVKDDPRALPPDLAGTLASRADLICHSRAERSFVEAAIATGRGTRPNCIVIETLGGEGAVASRAGQCLRIETTPLKLADPTGAGDTFAGGVIAALAQGCRDLGEIVEAGHRAAARLLSGRQFNPEESI